MKKKQGARFLLHSNIHAGVASGAGIGRDALRCNQSV
jgi:hypothetical protein